MCLKYLLMAIVILIFAVSKHGIFITDNIFRDQLQVHMFGW